MGLWTWDFELQTIIKVPGRVHARPRDGTLVFFLWLASRL